MEACIHCGGPLSQREAEGRSHELTDYCIRSIAERLGFIPSDSPRRSPHLVLPLSDAKALVYRAACASSDIERRMAGNLLNLQLDALHTELEKAKKAAELVSEALT